MTPETAHFNDIIEINHLKLFKETTTLFILRSYDTELRMWSERTMKNAVSWDVTPFGSCTDVSEERWFLQEPNGVTSQNRALFIVTAVKASNLTKCACFKLKQVIYVDTIMLKILNEL
jgi:hypothetical protein